MNRLRQRKTNYNVVHPLCIKSRIQSSSNIVEEKSIIYQRRKPFIFGGEFVPKFRLPGYLSGTGFNKLERSLNCLQPVQIMDHRFALQLITKILINL